MYKSRTQCWNEVMQSHREAKRRTAICQKMFGQDNLIGLTEEQRNKFWESV